MQNWRIVRVFISSTFRDMQAERDHLVKVVFPRLRERLDPYRIELIDIDLRWGITEEQSADGRVLELCLQQIDECRPFFLCLLGQRYGWVPDAVPANTANLYTWLRQKLEKSITELEILHGVLNEPRMQSRAFFFFRDLLSLKDVPQELKNSIFIDTDPVAQQKLAGLKETIIQGGHNVTTYRARWDPQSRNLLSESAGRLAGLEDFGAAVESQLFDAIKAELKVDDHMVGNERAAARDCGDRELDYHERFIQSRLRVFVGRGPLIRALLDYLNGEDDHPLMLTGPSGSGKSALLAHLVRGISSDRMILISHFVGASPRSTSLQATLARFCDRLRKEFFPEIEVPEKTDELVSLFHEIVSAIPASWKTVLIIDGIDQFDHMDNPQELRWIPRRLRANVRIVVSCIDDPNQEQRILMRAGELGLARLDVTSLTDEERIEIIRRVPSIAAKTLDTTQIEILMTNPCTKNPLFLLVALEELKGFGSFEHLTKRISQLPNPEIEEIPGGDAVRAVFRQVIVRLAEEFDTELVRHMLCFLASARRGLSEIELQGLIAGLSGKDDLYPVLRQLRPYLTRKGELLDFFHRGLWNAVHAQYMSDGKRRSSWNRTLAGFFGGTEVGAEDINIRVIDEVPWQFWQAKDWKNLYEVMANLDVLGALITESRTDIHRYWTAIESNSHFRMVDAYRPVIDFPGEYRKRFSYYKKMIWEPYSTVTEMLTNFGYHNGAEDLVKNLMKENEPDSREYRYCTMILKQIYGSTGQFTEALNLEAVEDDGGDVKGWDLIQTAVALCQQGELSKSMETLHVAEKLGRDRGYSKIVCQALANKSHIYILQDMFDQALAVLQEAETMAREGNEMDLLAQCLGNKGVVYREKGDLSRALSLHDQQRKICEEYGGRKSLNTVLCQQALVYEELGRVDDALQSYVESEALSREINDLYWLEFSLARQGHIRFGRGEYEMALVCYDECESLNERMGNRDGLRIVLEWKIKALEQLQNDEKLESTRRKLSRLDM